MERKRRTNEELRKASDHLYYEVSMLIATAEGLASGVAGQGPIANALIESFVIHVRVVMDFLYAEPKLDDVIAEDFFDSPATWIETRPQISPLLQRAKQRAHKEVAHLTYARLDVTPETKPWQFREIAKEITDVLRTFVNDVPKGNLSSVWLKETEP